MIPRSHDVLQQSLQQQQQFALDLKAGVEQKEQNYAAVSTQGRTA